jgi:hypothetical protein
MIRGGEEEYMNIDITEIKQYVILRSHLFENSEMDYLSGSITIAQFEEDEEIDMGSASVYIFQIDEWSEMLDKADSISGDVLYVMNSIINTTDVDGMYGQLLIIDEMLMDETFDSFEMRILFLERIINFSNKLGVNNIIFMNEAICKDSEKKGFYLNEYLSLGFKPIMNTDSDSVTLIKNLDYII